MIDSQTSYIALFLGITPSKTENCTYGVCVCFPFQGEVSSSQQLVHSEYLQLLTAFAVGLGLHTVLVSPPHPPHFQAPPPPKEWAWLSNFINAVSLAESLTKRSAMPDVNVPRASMPDIEPLPSDAKYQPSVSICMSISRNFC